MGDIDTSPNFVISCEQLLAKKLVMLHKRDRSVCVNLPYMWAVLYMALHWMYTKKIM